MNILIFAGCNDKKLISKISPILDCDLVTTVYLVRNSKLDFTHPKLKQYPTLKLFRKIMPLREINRLINGILILLTKKIDILLGIHFRMHCIYTYLLAKLFRKKYIFLLIESPMKYKKPNTLIKMLKGASLIGVRGNKSKQYLVNLGVPENKFFIPQNEFELPAVVFGKERKIYDLIYIGNFIDEKDLPLWVNVAEEVKKIQENVSAVMLGDGRRWKMIERMINEKGLKEDIKLVGRISDIYPYIDKSKILLMTSKSEGLPMVAVEAMSIKVPCVLPDVGDISDLIADGVNGRLITTRNPKDYADAIVSLLKDENKYKEISQKAYESIKQMANESTHDKIVKLWQSKLKDILNK